MDEGKGRLAAVKVKVGQAAFHDITELTSSWELVTKDTALRDVELKVEVVEGSDCTIDALVYD